MTKKVYYYKFEDLNEIYNSDYFKPYNSEALEDVLQNFLLDPSLSEYPYALQNAAMESLWQRVVARYYKEYLFKIEKYFNEDEPSLSEIDQVMNDWLINYLNLVAQTYEYYMTLLSIYDDEKANLMEDIKAISKNKVKFNDTPQNPNTADVYEGDDYITHFTSTEGETSSPLMSKMMRLKEIQDHYKNLIADWVNEFEKLFIEGENL